MRQAQKKKKNVPTKGCKQGTLIVNKEQKFELHTPPSFVLFCFPQDFEILSFWYNINTVGAS